MEKYRFRFDDVCINANLDTIADVTYYLLEHFPSCEIIYGISPLVHSGVGERVFPKIFNAMSDYRNFYTPDRIGFPKLGELNDSVVLAGHGLIHVDHRLLHPKAQEMSILVSCSLAKSKIFIPPFNKWNSATDHICEENGIELIKFENGWLSCEHNDFNPEHKLWYLHARDFNINDVIKWHGKEHE